jgi:hypothetical protein
MPSQNAPDCPEKLAQVYSKLAYNKIRSIAASNLKVTYKHTPFPVPKSANYVKDDGVPANRSLQTPQELLLFHRLLANNSNDIEGRRLSADERLGPKSKIAKDEWVFRRKQIDLLVARGDWRDLFNATHELLTKSRANNEFGTIIDARGADWLVWKGFLRAMSELQAEE